MGRRSRAKRRARLIRRKDMVFDIGNAKMFVRLVWYSGSGGLPSAFVELPDWADWL